jgi:hypothetical protein
VSANAATENDLLGVEKRLNKRIDRFEERLKAELRQLGQSMTIKLGSIVVVAVGVILAAQQLL